MFFAAAVVIMRGPRRKEAGTVFFRLCGVSRADGGRRRGKFMRCEARAIARLRRVRDRVPCMYQYLGQYLGQARSCSLSRAPLPFLGSLRRGGACLLAGTSRLGKVSGITAFPNLMQRW